MALSLDLKRIHLAGCGLNPRGPGCDLRAGCEHGRPAWPGAVGRPVAVGTARRQRPCPGTGW